MSTFSMTGAGSDTTSSAQFRRSALPTTFSAEFAVFSTAEPSCGHIACCSRFQEIKSGGFFAYRPPRNFIHSFKDDASRVRILGSQDLQTALQQHNSSHPSFMPALSVYAGIAQLRLVWRNNLRKPDGYF
ncbi:hypothetical protein JOM56_015067 [Amanita muscaria]